MLREPGDAMTTRGLLLLLILLLLQLLTSVVCEHPTSFTIQYKDLQHAPDTSYQLDQTTDGILSPSACLLLCSKNDLCRSMVLEGTKCSLYSTATATVDLLPGQIAIGEMYRTVKYD